MKRRRASSATSINGEGFQAIAHSLNARKVPSPRAQRGRPSGWEPSTIRAVLKRDLYRGTLIYNRTKKRLDDGSRRGRQRRRPESEWKRVDLPALRIIDPQLAERVDERLEGKGHAYLRTANGRLLGRPVEGRTPAHLPTRSSSPHCRRSSRTCAGTKQRCRPSYDREPCPLASRPDSSSRCSYCGRTRCLEMRRWDCQLELEGLPGGRVKSKGRLPVALDRGSRAAHP